MVKKNDPNTNYTLNWYLYVKYLTLNGNYPQIPVLLNFLLLYYSFTKISRLLLPPDIANTTIILMVLTPTFFAMGMTLWRDIPSLVASLLLFSLIIQLKNEVFQLKKSVIDIIIIVVFISFRPNIYLTIAIFLILLTLSGLIKLKDISIIVGIILFSYITSIFISNKLIESNYINEFYSQEWMRNDISCFIFKYNKDSRYNGEFLNIGGIDSWRSQEACNFLNRSSVSKNDLEKSVRYIPSVWIRIFSENPKELLLIHIERNHYLLPIPTSGLKKIPFIHSTIDENNYGIKWQNEKIAEIFRWYIRMWNFGSPIIAHVGIWTSIIVIFSFKSAAVRLVSFFAVSNIIVLFVIGPIPDARYGVFNLLIGQSLFLAYFVKNIKKQFSSIKYKLLAQKL
jgi:hypothetical protein